MARKRYRPEEIIAKLREAEVLLAQRTGAEPRETTRGSSPSIYLGSVEAEQRKATWAEPFNSVLVEPGGPIVGRVRWLSRGDGGHRFVGSRQQRSLAVAMPYLFRVPVFLQQ